MQVFTKCVSGLLMAGACMGLLYCHSNPEEAALQQTRSAASAWLDTALVQSGEQKLMAGGDEHSVAVVNNAVYAWGRNLRGQLGNSSKTDSYLPVPVATPDPAGR
jgi:alpha-tubulin suppressor-like RCC1 family protein